MKMPELQRPQFVILGGGLAPDGGPHQHTRERAEEAYRIYQRHGAGTYIFTGGNSHLAAGRRSGNSEAGYAAEVAHDLGLPEEFIRQEDTSTTTAGNLLNSGQFLEPGRRWLVSHCWHLPRALFLGEKIYGVGSVKGITVPGEDPVAERYERRQLLITKGVLLGVRSGNSEGVQQRMGRVERIATGVSSLLRHTPLGKHPAVQE